MERKSVRELKKLARNNGIDTTGMSRATLEYEIAKLGDSKVKNVYQPIAQLGVKGRDGKVFLVKTKSGRTYAKKQFRGNRSTNAINLEVMLQKEAASVGIAPKIKEYSLKDKYIVMEALDKDMYSKMQKRGGKLSQKNQREILRMFKLLDKIGIFHKDPNPLNFMFDEVGQLFIIDFGFSSRIDMKKDGATPNKDQMTLGLLLKFKALFPCVEYPILVKSLKPQLLAILDMNKQ